MKNVGNLEYVFPVFQCVRNQTYLRVGGSQLHNPFHYTLSCVTLVFYMDVRVYKVVVACSAPGFSFQLNCLLLASQENRRCHGNHKFSVAAKTVGLDAQKLLFTVLSRTYFHEIRR
jgi:hypothetical protein